jgi:SulP family sulfate permease
VAGIFHALFVLLFLLVAAPLAGYIPLAALAGVLAVVAWNMAEKAEFWTLLRSSPGDALVLLSTFLLVIFRDLSEGIVVGFAIGSLLFIHRMSQTAELREGLPLAVEDHADAGNGYEGRQDHDVLVYRIAGAFFFGAASAIGTTLDRLADRPRAFVLDLSEVPLLDSSAAHTIEMLGRKMARRGGSLYLTGARREVRQALLSLGLREPHAHYRAMIEDALAEVRNQARITPG